MAKQEVTKTEKAGLPAEAEFLNKLAEDNEGEVLGRDDISIPYLRILQQLSPQVDEDDPAYIEGAKPGMIVNTLTGDLYEKGEGFLFVPCAYKVSYVEWVPRREGGGLVAEYSVAQGEACPVIRDDSNNDVIQKGAPDCFTPGNHLLKTHTHVIRFQNKSGNTVGAVMNMTKTQLKPSMDMNGLIMDNAISGKAIRYAHQFKATTVLKTKGDDKWYVWHFERIGFANKDDILDAKAFAEALAAGEVKVDMEKSMDDTVAKPKPSENDAVLDEEVPF